MTRLDRTTYFMQIAKLTAQRGTCPRKMVGAVAVKDNRIIMSGYNGSISGGAHCEDVGCIIHDNHCIRVIHSEMNIICECAKAGISLNNATIYCTLEPCYNCLIALIAAGVSTIIYQDSYKDIRTNLELYNFIKVIKYG